MARSRPTVWALCCLVAALGVWCLLPPNVEAQDTRFTGRALQERFRDPDGDAAADDFVGTASCVECHDERHDSLLTSFHAGVLGDPTARGCESCHGPGKEHGESAGDEPIRDPFAADADEVLGICLRCHVDVLEKPLAGHRSWVFPQGPAADPVSCTQCHEVHVDRASPAFVEGTGRFRDRAALALHAQDIPARRCITCHPAFHPEMDRSAHAFLLEEGAMCGACHGPGSLHAQSGGRRGLILRPDVQVAVESNRSCMSCHRGGEAVARWTCAEHARERVRCATCHDPNAARGHTVRGPQMELCGSCHPDVAATFRLPYGHPVERGRVLCTDCHDAHGNRSRIRDRDLKQRACERCHAEKAGPFLHDHGIKRTEGCTACHAPHGSAFRRALTHPRVKPLCQQCHPEAPHDLSQRRFDNCIRCHAEFHGSDLDRLFRR